MKEIKEKDLVIGEVYADSKYDSVFLRYVGINEDNDPLFEYVSGVDTYYTEPFGSIGFKSNPNETWYTND